MSRLAETDNSLASSVEREVLPTNVKPIHYKVTLEPNFETFKFEGKVEIELEIQERTDVVTLNSVDHKIHEARIGDVEAISISFDEEKQTVSFGFDDHLQKGRTAHLFITFTGELNDKMVGFYRSSYQQDGKTKYLATTQMEPVDCRRAFPCFDEPALKARFEISLVADTDLVCLSNMDEKVTTLLEGNKKRVHFNTTPLMSTYLVAFIVGDLKCIENNTYRVPIKVYATPGSEHLGQYAVDIAAKTLKFFDEKFDIPYPLPKCDMVAIHDFSAGAMENFGLITFRVIDLLIDPANANISTKQRVTEVVMHELAHQWFGNLVTMDFWDGLWLNEGFATWMSWYACDSLFPDWKVWESYVFLTLQSALALDALRSSHPIEVPIKKADEINQIFDSISYNKGSSLLKMISKWLGEEVFIKGVSEYLKKHQWGNTRTSDLWHSLSEVSGKDVVKVMDIWTKNMGFPVVSVKELSSSEIEVTQHRFLATGDVTPEDDRTLYPVFLGLKTSSGIDESLTLNGRSKVLKINTPDDFFKINADQSGIYRTAYEPARWQKLGKAALEGKLSVEDRIGLVADASSLASSGFTPTTDLLNLVKLWTNENNYAVWDQISVTLRSIKNLFLFDDDSIRDALNKLILDMISSKQKEVGYEFAGEESFAEEQLKSGLFADAASAGDEEIIKFCQDSFDKYIGGNKAAIHVNIRAAVFGAVASRGDQAVFEKFLTLLQNPSSIDETKDASIAIGKFRDPSIVDQVCNLLMKPDIIKPQDIFRPMIALRSHKVGIEKLWNWLTNNWDEIFKYLPPESTLLGHVIQICVSKFTTPQQKVAVEKFFENKNQKGYDKTLAQALDRVSASIAWRSRDAENITDWLKKNNYLK